MLNSKPDIEGGPRASRFLRMLPFFVCVWISCNAGYAYEYSGGSASASLSGYLDSRAVYAFDRDTPKERPTTQLGLEFTSKVSTWSGAKILLRGVDDGTVKDPCNGRLFTEFDRIYQDKNPYVSPDEAYVDFYAGKVDFRLGIQKFAWGRLDEINPTDVLNPEDFTQGGTNEEIERKIGIPAVRTNVYSDVVNVEVAWVPRFVPYRLPTPEERWFPGVFKPPPFIDAGPTVGDVPVAARYNDIDLPAFTLKNSEAGIRISKYIAGWDLSVSYFSGYDTMPVMDGPTDLAVELKDPLALDYGLSLAITFEPALHRMNVFGFDFTTTAGSFTIRGEYAYFRNKYYNRTLDSVLEQEVTPARQKEIFDEFLRNYIDSGYTLTRQTFHIDPELNIRMDSMRYGLGVDYIHGDTSVSVQVIQEYIPSYDRDRPVYFNKNGLDTLVTFLFKRFFLQNTLELNLRAAYDIEFKDSIIKPSLKYNFTDSLQGTVGLIILGGKYSDSLIGQFADNDEAYVQLRCSF